MKLILMLILFVNSMSEAADQIPPLEVNLNEECHIAEAIPLLDSAKYKKESNYEIKTIHTNPLILRELIKLNDGHSLEIEQRGCEDIYFKFTYIAEKKSEDVPARVEKMVTELSSLKISKNALISEKKIAEIAEIAEKVRLGAHKLGTLDETTICLMKVSSECITDVKVKISQSQVELFYVDRP